MRNFQLARETQNLEWKTVVHPYTCLKFDQDDTADSVKIKISESSFKTESASTLQKLLERNSLQ
jgi:hypothetical protein